MKNHQSNFTLVKFSYLIVGIIIGSIWPIFYLDNDNFWNIKFTDVVLILTPIIIGVFIYEYVNKRNILFCNKLDSVQKSFSIFLETLEELNKISTEYLQTPTQSDIDEGKILLLLRKLAITIEPFFAISKSDKLIGKVHDDLNDFWSLFCNYKVIVSDFRGVNKKVASENDILKHNFSYHKVYMKINEIEMKLFFD